MSTILAIDPGRHLGWAVGLRGGSRPVKSGRLELTGDIGPMGAQIAGLLAEFDALSEVWVESSPWLPPSAAKGELHGAIRGVIATWCAMRGVTYHAVAPQTWKSRVLGRGLGTAKGPQYTKMINSLGRFEPPLSEDEAAAWGICAYALGVGRAR